MPTNETPQPAAASDEERRDFLARAGRFAVTAPAAALLLAAAAKRGEAALPVSGSPPEPPR